MQSLPGGLLEELARLLGSDNVSTDPAELRARDRDCWPALAMRERAGETLTEAAAVVWPTTTEQASALYRWATQRRVAVVPFGGGGGVCGGAAPVEGCVMADTKRLRHLGPLDDDSGIVRVGPGVIGQNLEEWLGARGWTLGHFPSSITVSSVGGFAAARSVGQASTRYGTFADMVSGIEAVLPDGTVVTRRPLPASAAGPDLVGLLLGAEGTLGLITSLDLRVHPKPEAMRFAGYRIPSFTAGLDLLRSVLRTGLRPAVLRLYDEADTALNHPDLGGCLLVTMCEGWGPLVDLEHDTIRRLAAGGGARDLGEAPGRHWFMHRYDVSYRLADYMKPGGLFGDAVALDTMELAAPWGALPRLYDAVRTGLAESMHVVLCHASHCYPDGACLYFTFGAAGQGDEADVSRRYAAAWSTAMRTALEQGGTITHHHGVGRLRARWLPEELGDGGIRMLRVVKDALDPAGIANPGALGLGGGQP